jgi:hypothetical protein
MNEWCSAANPVLLASTLDFFLGYPKPTATAWACAAGECGTDSYICEYRHTAAPARRQPPGNGASRVRVSMGRCDAWWSRSAQDRSSSLLRFTMVALISRRIARVCDGSRSLLPIFKARRWLLGDPSLAGSRPGEVETHHTKFAQKVGPFQPLWAGGPQ